MKEGAERAVREGLEEGAERAARDGVEEVAEEWAERAAKGGAGEASEETAGGTKALREPKYQAAARNDYTHKMTDFYRGQGNSRSAAKSMAEAEAKGLHATHRLYSISGGDPTDISGLQSGRVNSSLGAQWRGARSQSVEDYARELQKGGSGGKKIRVKLEKC